MYLQNAKTSERPPTPVHAILAKIFSQDLGHNLTQIHQSLVDFGKTDKMMPDLWKLNLEAQPSGMEGVLVVVHNSFLHVPQLLCTFPHGMLILYRASIIHALTLYTRLQ